MLHTTAGEHSILRQPIVSILLAAGKGSRMGFPKALLQINKELFLQKMLQTHYKAGIRHSLIVIQEALHTQVSSQLQRPQDMKVEWINSEPQWPQLASLWQAIEHLRQSSMKETPALLIGPVDQGPYPLPLIQTLCQQRSAQRDKVYIPSYNGKNGHPVLIEPAFVKKIERNHPEGLRGFFYNYPTKLEILPLPYPCISRNLNTQEQYKAFCEQSSYD